MKKLQALLIAGVAAGALVAASAEANIIIDSAAVPTDFSIVFDGNIDGDDVDGLTGQADFSYQGLVDFDGGDDNAYQFDVVVSNTSDPNIWDDSRISALVFNVVDLPDGGGSSGDWQVFILRTGPGAQPALPNGFGQVDICVKEEVAGACQGGGSGGVSIGEDPAVFTLFLAYDSVPSSITLSNFGVRYQSLTSAELGFDGDSGTGTGTPGNGTPVPEPATLALLGIGLLGAGYMARRRRDDA